MKTLLKNCSILIKESNKYSMLENAFMVITDQVISYIGQENPTDQFDKEYDLTNHLIMPGLINAHGHSPMTLLRGAGTGLKLQDWLFNCIFPLEEKLTPDDIYNGQMMAILEMLASGTTSYSTMYDFPYSAALAIAESKTKGSVCRTGLCFDPSIEMKDHERYFQSIELVDILYGRKEPNSEMRIELKTGVLPEIIKESVRNGDILPTLSFHSEYLTSEKYVKAIVEENKRLQVNLEIHVSETEKEHQECIERHRCTPIEYFAKNGALDEKTFCAHCVHVTDNDLDIMAKTKASLVYNPCSNMKLCSGMAPIKKAIDAGVNVALGTDGCASNDTLDMFKEMHTAALLSNLQANDPSAVSASTIIDMATINGAIALGRKDTGKLEIGYKADLAVIDLSKPHLTPCSDVAALIVYSMTGNDVAMTFVNGNLLYDHGNYPCMDIDKIRENFKSSLKRLGIHE